MIVVGIVLLIACAQHREPAAGARDEAAARGGDPAGARREALAPGPPAADREPAAVDPRRRRRHWCLAYVDARARSSRRALPLPFPVERGAVARSARAGLHRGLALADRDPVRPGAGAAGIESRRRAGAEERADPVGQRASAACARFSDAAPGAGRRAGGAVADGAHRRGSVPARAAPRAADRPGLRDERRAGHELQPAARGLHAGARTGVLRPDGREGGALPGVQGAAIAQVPPLAGGFARSVFPEGADTTTTGPRSWSR